MTYSEFLDEMKFQKYPMEGTLEQQIEFQLRHLGMNIVEFTKKYDIDNTRKLLDNELTATGKNKSQFGLNDDAIMLCYLGDNDVDIHPIDPIFVTLAILSCSLSVNEYANISLS